MTDSRLAAVVLVGIVLVAVVSGGTTFALLSDTESVDVAVTVDTVPDEPSGAATSGNDAPTVLTVTCESPADDPRNLTEPSTNTSGNGSLAGDDGDRGTDADGSRCLTESENGTNATDPHVQNETVDEDNETTNNDNETVDGDNETTSNDNETVDGDNETGDGDGETVDEDSDVGSSTNDESKDTSGSDTEMEADDESDG